MTNNRDRRCISKNEDIDKKKIIGIDLKLKELDLKLNN